MSEGPIRVLLIEDNPGDARLVKEFLAEAGGVHFEIVTADRLSTGMEVLSVRGADLVILDLALPDSEGLETLTRARQHAGEVPIVVLTGLDDEERGRQAIRAGAQDYLAKGRLDAAMLARTASYAVERKRLSERLLESEARKAAMLESALDGIVAIDSEGNITEFNRAAERMFGHRRDDVIGKKMAPLLIPPAQLERHQVNMIRLETTSQSSYLGRTMARTAMRADGTEIPVALSVVPFTVLGTTGYLAVIRDLTEQKAAEEVRMHREALLSDMGRIAAVGAWEFDAMAPESQMWTEEVFRIHEVDSNYHPTQRQAIEFYTPASRPIIERAFRDAIAEGKPFEVELELITAKGNHRFVHVIGRADGERGKIRGTVHDVSERRKAEELRLNREMELHESQRIAGIGSWESIQGTGAITWSQGLNFLLARDADAPAPTFAELPQFYTPESWERLSAVIATAIETGAPYDLEVEMIRADGATCWTTTRGEAVRAADGTLVKLRGTVHDISARRRAEKARATREAYLQAIMSNVPYLMWLKDPEGRFLAVNDVFAKSCGRQTSEDVVGKTDLDVWPADLARKYRADDEEVMTSRKQKKTEEPVAEPDGIRWVETFKTAILDEKGDLIGTTGIAQDITERRRAEESLALLATAVEQSAESIMITDPAGVIQYVNPAFELVSGWTRAEVTGQNPRLLKSGKQDAEFYRQMWAVLTRAEPWSGHLINKKKDGTLFEEEVTISPVRDRAGKTVNYVAVKRDVTREVQLEVEMRQSQKMEAVGLLAGGVAHDFNNILSVIKLQAELTGMAVESPEAVREGLLEINTAADRAGNLTRQLLLFSRRQVMQRRNLDLNDVVSNLVKMLGRIVGEDVQLQLSLCQRPMITNADAGMLDQVIMNLVVNARDAMPDGGQILIATDTKELTTADVTSIPGANPGRHLCLRVTDNGCGISPAHLPRLFEPFFTTKDPGKGTGLGLATVFGIVKQHGGSITVDSELGQGTTFEILLPAAEVPNLPFVGVHSISELRRGTETILLVEDESTVRTLMGRVLSTHGYRVLKAADGVEALGIWEQHADSIDLLLTDMVMPNGISGRELAARLRARNPKLRVVYTSGYSVDIAGVDLTLEEGQSFLEKPYPTEEVLVTVRRCLDV